MPGDVPRITKYFKAASENYTQAADKIRIVLARVDYFVSTNQKDAAISLLKSEVGNFAKLPEAKSLEVRLAELQPKPKK